MVLMKAVFWYLIVQDRLTAVPCSRLPMVRMTGWTSNGLDDRLASASASARACSAGWPDSLSTMLKLVQPLWRQHACAGGLAALQAAQDRQGLVVHRVL